MAIEDWIYPDAPDFDPEPTDCIFCGKKNLEWRLVKREWKLCHNLKLHVCKNKMTKKQFSKDQKKVGKWLKNL